MELSIAHYLEVFHLIFMRQFSRQIAADLYAIKGGCNLRFFFNSVRYSEDLDIDVHTISVTTLKNKVDKILASTALLKSLQSYGIEDVTFSALKQTSVTQRWKMQLRVKQLGMPLNTKIEFSRRQAASNDDIKGEGELAAVVLKICQQYQLSPMRFTHYPAQLALQQKVLALAHRSATQARDVFDIYHLLHMHKPTDLNIQRNDVQQAQEALCSIDYAAYQSQVVSFLEHEYQVEYAPQTFWDDMSAEILNFLQGIS